MPPGACLYEPADPMGEMFFNVLATFAEYEGDLIRLRTREDMAITRAKGKRGNIAPQLWTAHQKGADGLHIAINILDISALRNGWSDGLRVLLMVLLRFRKITKITDQRCRN